MYILGHWNEREGYVVPKCRHSGAWQYIKNTLIASRVIDRTKEERCVFLSDDYLTVCSCNGNREILRVPRFPSETKLLREGGEK